jgi:tRNA nucleotidyltransferase (CCA-adding enzyme)
VPNDCRDLAVLASRHHGKIHRAAELRAATMLELFEAADAFRRADRFAKLLLVCEADARGRGPDKYAVPYVQAERLRSALTAAAAARPDPRALESAAGPVIAERFREARLAAIRAQVDAR